MRAFVPPVFGNGLEFYGVSVGERMKVRLGDLTFDGDARQLRRGTTEVHLSPKAFELLKVLVESRPRAIAKSELHERLWPATFVSEVNLATLIAEIRGALGDDARHPRFIRTAHRFGYAFCGPAEIADARPEPDTSIFCWLIIDGRRTPLRVGENILGREPADGIKLDSPTVSRHHARIVIANATAFLEDLESKNGTFLRGQRVSSAVPLADGDEIRTGSVQMSFRMAAPGGLTSTWSGDE